MIVPEYGAALNAEKAAAPLLWPSPPLSPPWCPALP
jgi:hypothetical protein